MKKRMGFIGVAAALVAVLFTQPLLSLVAADKGDMVSPAEKVFTPWEGATDIYVPVGENDRYTLSVRAEDSRFQLAEKQGGSVLWYSAMTEETYSGLADSTEQWVQYMSALVAVNYTTAADTRGNIMTVYNTDPQTSTDLQRGENGVRFTFEFPELSLGLAMEVSLINTGLVVDIPADSVYEKGEYVFRSVEVLPFFGAVAKETTTDGYLVYPDGSGAISYFDRVEDKSAVTQPIVLPVYDTLNLEDTLSESKDAAASLPIFGIKQGAQAMLGAITAGEENAVINVCSAVDNAAVPIHRSSFEVFYRNEYRIYLSSIKGVAGEATETFGTKLDKDLQAVDHQFTYFLLQGDEADYSGMAQAYRGYLLDTGVLTASSGAKTALFLNLFMGIEKEEALVSPLVAMTSYQKAEELCRELLASGVESLDVLLRGWDSRGFGNYPASGKSAGALGGSKGLKALNALATESAGRLNIQLETELLYTNKNRYISVKGTTLPITNEEETVFLLSPLKAEKQLNNMLNATKKYPELKLALSTLGTAVYTDYADKGYVTRGDTVATWKKLLEEERVGGIQGGNLYALGGAEYLYDLPVGSSLQQMTDRDIPWYSLVVSGSMPYVTVAGNRTGDLQRTKLQWIEYGASPYFELTERSARELRDTTYNELFTSTIAQWQETVFATWQEFNQRLEAVKGQAIVRHTYIGKEQVKLTYENGCAVLINYGKTPFTYEGHTVPAEDYLVCT